MSITIKRARRAVKLVTDMSLVAEHDQAKEEFAVVAANKPIVAMEVPDGEVTTAAARIADLERRMAETRLVFTLEALPRKEFAEYQESHPPRDGSADDAAAGLNLDESDDLIAQCIISVKRERDGLYLYVRDDELAAIDPPAWVEDADRFTPAEWSTLAESLGDGQWLDFIQATLEVNRGSQAPFLRAASLVIQRSEQTSKRPNA
ncbi:MAG: hypothetical protein QM628_00260 [Propionicimonas sp.]